MPIAAAGAAPLSLRLPLRRGCQEIRRARVPCQKAAARPHASSGAQSCPLSSSSPPPGAAHWLGASRRAHRISPRPPRRRGAGRQPAPGSGCVWRCIWVWQLLPCGGRGGGIPGRKLRKRPAPAALVVGRIHRRRQAPRARPQAACRRRHRLIVRSSPPAGRPRRSRTPPPRPPARAARAPRSGRDRHRCVRAGLAARIRGRVRERDPQGAAAEEVHLARHAPGHAPARNQRRIGQCAVEAGARGLLLAADVEDIARG